MEFRILGPLEVLSDGTSLALGGPKQRALLCVLLLNANEVVSTDRLIDEVWGERPPADGPHALQVLVSQLRRVLADPQVLLTRPPGYVLRVEPGQLDVHRFEELADDARRALARGEAETAATRLRDALALWRGPPLGDFAYEAFAQPAIGRLEESRLAAVANRIEADLALGRHAELVGELEELADRHPLVERFRGQLMLALYRSGRQREALDVYQELREALVERLGLDPSPELQRLQKAILQHDPELALGPTPRAAPAAAESEARTPSIVVVPLNDSSIDALAALAEPLARSELARDLILARLADTGGHLARATELVHERRDRLLAAGVTAHAVAFTSTDHGADIVRLASEEGVDLLLMDAPPAALEPGPFQGDLEVALAEAPCDVALLVARDRNASGGPVLVPFGGVEHDWAALEIGTWIAKARGTSLKLVGTDAIPERGQRDASRLLANASIVVQRFARVAAEPVLAEPGGEGLLRAAREGGLIVVGLSERWRDEGLGEARLALVRRAEPPVLLVRRGTRPGALSPRGSLTRFRWSISKPT